MSEKKNIDKRSRFVQEYINNSTSTTSAVKELSAKLFITERQVYRDLKKSHD